MCVCVSQKYGGVKNSMNYIANKSIENCPEMNVQFWKKQKGEDIYVWIILDNIWIVVNLHNLIEKYAHTYAYLLFLKL